MSSTSHEAVTGVDPAAIRRGHESDLSDVSMIWAIPIAVVIFIVLGVSVAAAVFFYFHNPAPGPLTHPQAMARNSAPLNERMGRLGRAGQAVSEESGNTEQPRLEGLRLRRDNGSFTTQDVLPIGNSPEYHPEDLRPELQANLQKTGWVDHDKKVARITIEEAMKVAGEAKLFPVQKDAVKLMDSWSVPTAANAGRGAEPPAVEPPHDKDKHDKDKHEKDEKEKKEKDKKGR